MRDFVRPPQLKADMLLGQTLRFFGATLIETQLGSAYQITATIDDANAAPFTFIAGFKSPMTRDILQMFDTSPEPFRGIIQRQASDKPGHAAFYYLEEPAEAAAAPEDGPF